MIFRKRIVHKRIVHKRIAMGIAAVAITLPVMATEAIQPLAAIQQRAFDFLVAQNQQSGPVEVQVNPLDPYLRLANCPQQMEAFLPTGGRSVGPTSVGVRCPGPQPWTIYVRANVRAFGEVLVATRFLQRGTILTAADLKAERHDLSTLLEYETDAKHLLGKQLRRPFRAGTVISPRAVIERPLVKQGDRVTVLARQNEMEVSSSGIALRDATLGEHVAVRNESSQRVIEGKVVGDHRVEVE